jgi:hypothetical protein
MDADQFKQLMLAFQTQHQQFLELVLPLQAPNTSTQQVRIQLQLIWRCLSLLKISTLNGDPLSTIASDLKTFLK